MLVREDERVEPALVDEYCFLGSANGVAFRDPIVFVIYMRGDGSSTQLSADLTQLLPQGALAASLVAIGL